ncbi:outer membrane protein assembly factor BamB family protein [Streptomyces griseochromogenes]|uniref:outer membrane protein assembly factor BamB family protein n=1 Tax=Streptomyces griseochromogenes TaxID=68214 RepID=UPI0037BAB506
MSFGPPPSMITQSAPTVERSRAGRRRRVIAVVVVAVLLVGAGLLWHHSGGRTKGRTDTTAVKQAPDAIRATVEKAPESPEGQVVVQHNEGNLTDKPRYAPGTWATGKILARAVAHRIEGYKIEPGYDDMAWKLQLDGHVCAVSRDVTADGRTAVVVQPPDSGKKGVCDEVLLVDLDTGKKLWQKKMPAADFAYVTNTNIALTKGVVAIAWDLGSVAYDMDSGRRLWNTTLATSQCHDSGYTGGRALLALVTCGQADDTTYRVERLDPRTGRVLWRYAVSRGVQGVYLPSADPPVLAVEAGDSEVTDLLTLDPKNGKRLATLPMHGYDPKCGEEAYPGPFFGVVDKCDGMVVGRDRIFVMSKENNGDLEKPADRITAFDVGKGTKAAEFEGRPFQLVVPVRTNGDDLIIYRRSMDDVRPSAIVDWNSRTDKETPYLLFQLPEDDEGELSDPERSDIRYEQGRAFFARRVMERDYIHPKSPILSVIGVGSAGLKH